MTGTTTSIEQIDSGASELWYTRCPVPTAFGVALERGDYDREFGGGELAWRALQQSPDPATRASHFTHAKQSSFRHGGNVPAIWARASGADTRLLGVSWLPTSYRVLALPESGIDGPADLVGRRLLVLGQPGDGPDVWKAVALRVYESALRTVGRTLADVTLVELPPRSDPFPPESAVDLPRTLHGNYAFQRNVLVPLLAGHVDAVVSQSSYAIELAGLSGAHVVHDTQRSDDAAGRINNDAPDVLTVSGRLLDEHPERVARVVGQAVRAAAWAREHPDAALTTLGRELQLAPGLAEAAFGSGLANGLELRLDRTALDALAAQQELLLRHGLIPAAFDVEEWAADGPLRAAQAWLATDPASPDSPSDSPSSDSDWRS